MTEPKWNKFEAFALESRMRLKGSSFRGRKIKFQLFPRWKPNDVIDGMLVLKVIKQFKVNWFVDELLQKKRFFDFDDPGGSGLSAKLLHTYAIEHTCSGSACR